MLPSCLEAHAMPSHENGDRAPRNIPSTRQLPLAPATAPGPPAVPCLEYTHLYAHETKEEEKNNRKCQEKWRKQRTAGKVRQVRKGGDFQVGALRGQGCTNGARSESEIICK